jgi:S-DNA-T family DNA segregation ATPase FtsK/SpoIIIE
VLLGYLALLTTLHSVDAGGRLGAAMGEWLRQGVGGIGLFIVLVTWWMIVILLASGITIEEALQLSLRLLGEIYARGISPLAGKMARRRGAGSRPLAPDIPGSRVSVTPRPASSSRHSAQAEPQTVGADQVWRVPSLDEILAVGEHQDFSAEILREQAHILEETLVSLGAPAKVMEINRGPVVTQFGVRPEVVVGPNGKETKVKVSRIATAANDLALALEAKTLRVEAPIPGKGLVGIEVPNPEVSLVALRDVMESRAFARVKSPLRLGLGQDVSGNPVVANLTAMPHLLIAGTTGSGKSVCVNAIIASLLLQNAPGDLKFLMVDPKRVELTGYTGIPHLLSKVVVDMERVTSALQWVLREMDGRYRLFSELRATHILDYNERIVPGTGKKRLPYIVVIVDELADMMMMAPQETERAICRIAQMSRATGIHLVIATQRPSVDVVTGLIKANFPARIAFNVASVVDSRVILDMPGAEQLLGQGDMLFLPPDVPTPMRLQGAFVSDEELRRLVSYWKQQGRPEAAPIKKSVQQPLWEGMPQGRKVEYADELMPNVIDVVMREQRASISLLQRKLRIGYTRAARIMDILEENGVVGPQPPGGKAREVFPQAAHAMLRPKGET